MDPSTNTPAPASNEPHPTPAPDPTPDPTPTPAPDQAPTPEPKGNEGNDTMDESNPLLNPPKEEGDGTPAPEMTDEAFAEAIVADEGASYSIDSDLVKAMVPHLREAGLSAEKTKQLANALAKYQYDQDMKDAQARQERMKEFKPKIDEMIRENPNAPKEWNAALQEIAKYDPVFVHVVRGSELGFSPAMLRLLSAYGRPLLVDGGIGMSAGASAPSSDRDFVAQVTNGIYK